jgi:glycerol-3-phosphate acyltransferase PlsY
MAAGAIVDVGLVGLAAYLIGAIPFSYIAGKTFARIDLREHGSGNLGASNTFRLLGSRIAVAVLAGDVAKGFVPVFLASWMAPYDSVPAHWLMLVAALMAVLGHMFSPYVRFSGGKGVATTTGAFLALSPAALGVTFIVFAAVFAARRIVSLASISSAAALPIVVFALDRTGVSKAHWSLLTVSILIAVVMLVKHHSNIKRLLAGEEPALQRTRR